MGSTDQIQACADLVKAIDAMRSGDTTFLESVRRIAAFRCAVGAADFDPDFIVLVAADSESDHLPNAHAKLMSTDAWLAHCAAEERELQEVLGPQVLAACDSLRARFASEA